MHAIAKCFVGWSALFLGLTPALPRESAGEANAVRVLALGEHALVEDAESRFLRDELARAQADGVPAVLLRIDCPGGFAWETQLLVKAVAAADIPVVAWIEKEARGAGALVALACDRIYLDSDAELGGLAKPIEWRGPRSDLPQRLTDKKYTDVIDEITGTVGANAASPEVVRGFVDEETEVTVGEVVLSGDGDVLGIDDPEELKAAVLTFGGVATSVDEVAKKEGWRATAAIAFGKEGGTRAEEEAEDQGESESAGTEKDAERKEGKAEEPAGEKERGFGETKLESYAGRIVVISVEDDTLLRSTKFEFMERVLKKADEEKASAIILDMNTPGGLAWHTVDIMMDELSKLEVPTYTYVNPKAMSAGSLIAVATDHIYMHDPSTIGAAGVVSSLGELTGTIKEKVTRSVMAAARGTAGSKGHPEDVAMAFIDPEIEVVRDLPVVNAEGALDIYPTVVNPKDEMLVLDAKQATQLFDGKPLLAEGVAKDIGDLIRQAGIEGEVIRAKPLGFEKVADWIVKWAILLLFLGLAGAFIELKTPGFGLPGLISLLCFGLFFFGHNLAGKLAGYELIGVFLLGVVLLIMEIFVFPGVFVLGLSGVALMIGSLVFAMVDKFDWDTAEGINYGLLMEGLSRPLFNIAIALIGAIFLVVILIRWLPESRAMQWLMLDTAVVSGTGIEVTGETGEAASDLVGRHGDAQTDLRPAGKANFDDLGVLDVITGGEFVGKGAKIEIIRHEGARIVVEEC